MTMATVSGDALLVPLDPRVVDRWSYRYAKRAMDVGVSAVALVAVAPLMAVIATLIRWTAGRPVLYRWEVVGAGGRAFTGYKFGTMVVGADVRRQELAAHNERGGPCFKMRHDPRVTPLGRVLRKFSLDELPQLWSVLRGDMSLVGPRPVIASEWLHFEPWQRRKLSVRPGAVSLWHVTGKAPGFEEWVRCDLLYIERWSLWLDVKILWLGVSHIVRGTNY